MNKILMSSALALAVMTAPASSQLLGGGGGGGGLGGIIGGGLGGLGTMNPIGSGVTGTLDGSVSAHGSHSIDRHSGTVSGSGGAAGSVGSAVNGATGGASGSANGNIAARAIGTDAVRGAAGNTATTARSAVGGVANAASGTGGAARNATGSASAGATGASSASLGRLALAGTAAANSAGSFDVAPGMIVQDAKGRTIGTVQTVRSTAQGSVESVMMKVGDKTASLPAANFSGAGNVLVSSMGKAEVTKAARTQAGSSATMAGNGSAN